MSEQFITNGVSKFSEELNPYMDRIVNRINNLEQNERTILQNRESHLNDFSIKEGTNADRVVQFNSNGQIEEATTNPVGIYTDNVLFINGERLLPTSIIDTGSITVGVQYYLSTDGKISQVNTTGIKIGTFTNIVGTFLINIENTSENHYHFKQKLTPDNWVDSTTLLDYDLEKLPQPFTSLVVILENKYVLTYDTHYYVDAEGLHLKNLSEIETLLGISSGTLYSTISDTGYITDIFYADYLTHSVPGVSSIKTSTLNITNSLDGASNTNGSLIIDYKPTIENKSDGQFVRSLAVNPNSGTLEIYKASIPSDESTASEQDLSEGMIDDYLLLGALVKTVPNTISTYLDLPSDRKSGVRYKTLVPNRPVTISVYYMGTYNGEATAKVTLSVASYGESPDTITVDLPITTPYTLTKKEIITKQFNQILYISIERDIDTSYDHSIGIIGVSVS
jgi:hypothetical protein